MVGRSTSAGTSASWSWSPPPPFVFEIACEKEGWWLGMGYTMAAYITYDQNGED